MSLGKELLQRRSELIEAERKLNEQRKKEIESQWKVIKYAIDNTEITKYLKYIDLGYFPDIFKENTIRLHNEDFTVFQDKNKCIRLYLSEEDYKNDIQELILKNDALMPKRNIDDVYGKLKSETKIDKDTINSDKKSDFKINNNKQVEYDNDFKINIVGADELKFNEFSDVVNKCIKAMASRRTLNWI